MTESEEKTRKLHLSQEAKRILSDPMVESFLIEQEAECLEAMKRLPIGADSEVLRTIHHDLLAVGRFKSKLQSHIEEYKMVMSQEQLEDNAVEGI